MSLLTIVAYLTSFACVACYTHLAITKRPRLYHWSNVLGGIVLVTYNTLAGAYPNLVLEVPYTIVAAFALYRMRRTAL